MSMAILFCGIILYIRAFFFLLCIFTFHIESFELGFIFIALYLVLPFFVYFINFLIKRRNLKNKPVLKIYSDWFVKGIRDFVMEHHHLIVVAFPVWRQAFILFVLNAKQFIPKLILISLVQDFKPWNPTYDE